MTHPPARGAPDLHAPAESTTPGPAMTGGAGTSGTSGTSGTPATAPGRRRVRWSRVLAPLLSLAIVGGVFFYFLPQFTSISDVWASIRSMTWLESTTLILVALWNLATYWFVMVSTMPGLRIREAAVVTESSTAVANTVPGGGAIGIAMSYSMYSSWGFSRTRSSVSLLVAGVWNNFVKLAMPVLALALLAFSGGGAGGGRIIAGSLGIAGLVAAITIFALLLRSQDMARRIGLTAGRVASALIKPLRRPPVHGWELATVKFRDRTLLLLRARWLLISVLTLVSHLSLFLVLLLSLRYVGVSEQEVSWIEALAVFAFARLLSAVPLTPGGIGVVEVALITGLAAAGGARAQVAAGVLIFRALTYVLPIPVGLATYVFWRRNHSWRRPPNSAPRTSLVPESTSLVPEST
jgi:putative heme transporter